ncbi:MAG TPA: CARDB domain-containing protein [Gaiellaceae bacterium]|nr:CARDB domain-containing protein [Gaiellaceae bacterium]
MFDREKTETQSDIEFDFFDESPTAESAPRRGMGLPRRRSSKRPPTPPGGPQLYRLGVLIAGAIVLAVILILVVQSCRSSQKQSEYEGYVDDVSGIASTSEELGAQLNTSLTTPGITLEDLRGDVEGLRDQQEQLLRSAQDLQPPGPLLEQQESLVETMQFRVNGLAGLATALTQVAQSSNTEQTGADLASQAQRLVASDIVYADAFEEPTGQVLDEEGIADVPVPGSRFVRNAEFASPTAWNLIVERLTQSPQAGGLHGNGIQAVRWLPEGEQLSATEDNTVVASDRLAFEVVVENSGDSQETQVRVRLVIQQNPAIRQEQVIDLINPGETKTVRFSDISNVTFSTRTTLMVNVEPVPGETNEGNNSAQYRVIFTLG